MPALTEIERQIRTRVKELRPDVAEFEVLVEVLAVLERGESAPLTAKVPPAAKAPAKSRRRGGKRSTQALRLVKKHPGITVAELADKMQTAPTYLYKVLPDLVNQGKLRKVGKGYETVPRDSSN